MTQEQNNGSEGLAGEYLSCVCIKLKVQLDLCSPDMGLSEQQFALLQMVVNYPTLWACR